MKEWKEINSALNSEIEDFDRFMTGKKIDGEKAESFTEKEFEKAKSILEEPLPDRFIQEKLLKQHIHSLE